ncbi:MAG TPA: tetratricopeptide repeat protein, partial [Planctomycetota bacterium]|nr:tetratricopeptide repeat protein [Planctomycetota bacterium]
YQDACEDTRVRHDLSEDVLDRRMACLDRRLNDVARMLVQFHHADAATVEQAVRVAERLDSPSLCGDSSKLLAGTAPAPAAIHDQVASLLEQVDECNLLVDLGRLAEARRKIGPVVQQARTTGYKPIIAEAEEELGIILHKLGEPGALEALDDAALAAEAAHDDNTAAEATILAVEVLGMDDKADEARERGRRAQAALDRLGDAPGLEASLGRSMAMTELHAGNYQAALAHIHRAMDLDIKNGFDTKLVGDRHDLAAIQMTMGDYDEGVKTAESVLRAYEESLGPNHPSVADTLQNLAAAYLAQRKLDKAEAAEQRALDIHVAMHGTGSLEAVDGRSRLAMMHAQENKFEQACAEFEKILPALLAIRPADSEEVVQARSGWVGALIGVGDYAGAEQQLRLVIAARRKGIGQPLYLASDIDNLSSVLTLRGHYREAETTAREALAMFEVSAGLNHPSAAYGYNNLADAERLQGRLDAAEEDYRKALAVWEKVFGPDYPQLGYALTGLGQVQLGRGRPEAARPLLERALALRLDGDPYDLG